MQRKNIKTLGTDLKTLGIKRWGRNLLKYQEQSLLLIIVCFKQKDPSPAFASTAIE
jgi:hypothetical protein